MIIQHAAHDMDCMAVIRTVTRADDIPPFPKLILLLLLGHQPGWRTSRAVIVQTLGMSTGSVHNAMNWLKTNGYMTTDGHTVTVTPNRSPAEQFGVNRSPGDSKIAHLVNANRSGAEQKIAQELSTISKQKNKEENPPNPPKGGDDAGEAESKPRKRKNAAEILAEKFAPLEAEFEEWWKAYPRHEDKMRARKAYVGARDKTTADVLLAGAKGYAVIAAKRRAERPNGQDPVAHPSSWLNGERWTDETVAHAVPQSKNDAMDWIRDCYREGSTKPIEERTGMKYPAPPLPMDLTRDEARAWRLKSKRDWINNNHNEILRRVTMKAVS